MTVSSEAELKALQRVGRLVAATLRRMQAAVRPGITTQELDQVAASFARAAGARSAPQLAYNFPGFTCISVNEQVVHGIPGPRTLLPGDLVKLDVTLELGGFMADSAVTVAIPPVAEALCRLQNAVRVAFGEGLAVARAGRTLREVGQAVEDTAARDGFAVLRELSGHGIGRTIHEEPDVPNWADPAATRPLQEGQVLALEPMFALRRARVVREADGWTLRTHNRAMAAHYEHTIVVRQGAPLLLTA